MGLVITCDQVWDNLAVDHLSRWRIVRQKPLQVRSQISR